MKKLNKKGFTIVELVIVISVIAILSAVMVPTFSNAISNSKDSAALQSARNAYTAYTMECAAPEDDDAAAKEAKVNLIYKGENDRYVVIENGQMDKNSVYTGEEALIKGVKGKDANVAAFKVVEVEDAEGFYTIADATNNG